MTSSQTSVSPNGFLEVELKLALPANQIERFKRHPSLRPISPHRAVVSELDAIYFDTDQLELQSQGIALRLRQAGTRWVQTVKTRGQSVGGLHQRTEWEYPSDGIHLNFDAITHVDLRNQLTVLHQADALKPIFRTRFRRWARLLVLPDGSQIELAVDHGSIEAGKKQDTISEIELELKAGRPEVLFDVALGFMPDIALQIEIRSKAERGYVLFTGEEASPRRMQVGNIPRSTEPAEACALFIETALEQLQRNWAGAIIGSDPEFIHQARVALRRLRATFGVFRSVIPHETALPLRNGLRSLMSELGPARDWDVFLTETLPALKAAMPQEPGLTWLTRAAQDAREQAQRAAASALQAKEMPTLLLQLGRLACHLRAPVINEDQITRPPKKKPLPEFARSVLRKRAKQADVDAASLAQLDIEARHAWRITLKKLRYSGDFLAPVFGRKDRTRRWIDALSSLQDILGSLNDAATTERLISQIAPKTKVQKEIAATLRGFTAGASYIKMQELEKARLRLERSPEPWKK
jgi:triphosphatase